MSLPFQSPPSHASHRSLSCSHHRYHRLHHCYHHSTRHEVSPTLTTLPMTLIMQTATMTLTTKMTWHTHLGVPHQQWVSQPQTLGSRERQEVMMTPTDVAHPSGCATSTTTYSMMNAHNPGRQYFTVPHLFLQESGHSSKIPVEFHWNKTGIKQPKVEILYLTVHILPIYRTTYFSLLSLLFLHLFKSVSQFLQSVYSSTLPSKFNFKYDFVYKMVESRCIEWHYINILYYIYC